MEREIIAFHSSRQELAVAAEYIIIDLYTVDKRTSEIHDMKKLAAVRKPVDSVIFFEKRLEAHFSGLCA